MEPPNKGHPGANSFVPCRPISEVKYGAATSVLCREVVPISEGPLSEVPLYTVEEYLVKVEEGEGEVGGSVGGRELERDGQYEGQILRTPVVPLYPGTQVSHANLLLFLLLLSHHWGMRGLQR